MRGPNRAADMKRLPALSWPDHAVARHTITIIDSTLSRVVQALRWRPPADVRTTAPSAPRTIFATTIASGRSPPFSKKLDRFVKQGVEYIYFIDEIFLPDAPLLAALAERNIKIGVQTRLDLWNEESIRALAKAGCVSVEAGVESITEAGRAYLDKKCKMSTDELTQRLIFAKTLIPFVQANLLAMAEDDEEEIEAWRHQLETHGVWSNKPVPLFPYPGSPQYTRMWGAPDDFAWERAHEFYLKGFDSFSDIQEQRPQPLVELEVAWHDR